MFNSIFSLEEKVCRILICKQRWKNDLKIFVDTCQFILATLWACVCLFSFSSPLLWKQSILKSTLFIYAKYAVNKFHKALIKTNKKKHIYIGYILYWGFLTVFLSTQNEDFTFHSFVLVLLTVPSLYIVNTIKKTVFKPLWSVLFQSLEEKAILKNQFVPFRRKFLTSRTSRKNRYLLATLLLTQARGYCVGNTSHLTVCTLQKCLTF